jgi:DTW domain-containing protein YfiP
VQVARSRCDRCRRPPRLCWCDRLQRVESRTRVCFLQHPRETRVAIGTARMAHLSLANSELHQGVDFGANPGVRALAAAAGTMLLFPGPGALEPEQLAARPPAALLVVDGTWAHARKIVQRNLFLSSLPRVAFRPAVPGNYRVREEPSPECTSTIEAVAHVLGVLEGEVARFQPLLDAFERMVELQLAWKRDGVYQPRRRGKGRAQG